MPLIQGGAGHQAGWAFRRITYQTTLTFYIVERDNPALRGGGDEVVSSRVAEARCSLPRWAAPSRCRRRRRWPSSALPDPLTGDTFSRQDRGASPITSRRQHVGPRPTTTGRDHRVKTMLFAIEDAALRAAGRPRRDAPRAATPPGGVRVGGPRPKPAPPGHQSGDVPRRVRRRARPPGARLGCERLGRLLAEPGIRRAVARARIPRLPVQLRPANRLPGAGSARPFILAKILRGARGAAPLASRRRRGGGAGGGKKGPPPPGPKNPHRERARELPRAHRHAVTAPVSSPAWRRARPGRSPHPRTISIWRGLERLGNLALQIDVQAISVGVARPGPPSRGRRGGRRRSKAGSRFRGAGRCDGRILLGLRLGAETNQRVLAHLQPKDRRRRTRPTATEMRFRRRPAVFSMF